MTSRTFGLLLTLAVAAMPMAALAAPEPAVGIAQADETTRQFIERMDEYFAPLTTADPTSTRGTGFKPYQRYKHFVERRLDPVAGDLAAGTRWEAYQELKNLEAQMGTRSETWFSLGPINVAGRCLAIEVHPENENIVYAGFASSGLWKTTDTGLTWTPIGDYLPTLAVGAIEIDPDNPDRMWIGTGEGWGNTDAIHGVGVMISYDGGETFELSGYNYDMGSGRDVYELEYNPATGTLMVAADNGLWRSTDGGITFTQIQQYGQWKDIELKRGSATTMFASVHSIAESGFYRSTDDGLTWTWLNSGLPTTGINNNRFALTDADPDLIYFAISNAGGGTLGIYKSTNGGDSWTQVSAANHYGTQGWYNLTIDVRPTDPNWVFSGGVYFYRSTNGGVSYQQTAGNVHVDHHATAWAPTNSNHFWVGSDGGCYLSTNGGSTFMDRNTGLTTLQFYAVNHAESMPTRALGGTQDNGTYIYNNSLNWSYGLGGDGFFCEVHRSNPDIMYAELYYGQHYRSVNGGANFYIKMSGITEDGPWSTPTHMDFSNSDIVWTAHNSKIFKTTNSANNWFWTNNPAGLGGGRSIHQCRDYPQNVVVIGGTKVWLTTDSGSSWIDRTSNLFAYNTLTDIHVHPNDPDIMVATCGTYSSTIPQVWKTTDQGVTWNAIDSGLPNEPANTIEIDPSNPDWYFLGTDLAVYVSFDAGASWQPFNTGFPHVVVADLRVHDPARLLRAGTHGRGLWEVDISNLNPVAVDDTRPEVQPLALRVYGNPTSGPAVLHYGLREAGQVDLAIYDLQGRQVRSLVNRFEQPIMGSIDVDLSDLPSGVYFARLDANGASISKKIVVEH